MIVGFKRFETAFLPPRESFILIGGTAVQMVLGQYDSAKGVANRARVTHDIDLLVVTDNLTDEFKLAFHRFIEEGAHECYFSKERPHYYRFLNPKNADYPNKVELLSHSLLDIPGIRYTPLSVERDESMSAMVLEEELYQYAVAHCRLIHGFKCLKSEALIVFKIAAYLNLMEEYSQTGDARRRNDALKHQMMFFASWNMLIQRKDAIFLPQSKFLFVNSSLGFRLEVQTILNGIRFHRRYHHRLLRRIPCL